MQLLKKLQSSLTDYRHMKDDFAGPRAQQIGSFYGEWIAWYMCRGWKILLIEMNSFELEYAFIGNDGKTYLVALRCKTCSCMYLDIDGYPCVHAIAATYKFSKHDDTPYDMCICMLCARLIVWLRYIWALACTRTIYLVYICQNGLFRKE